MPYFTYDTSVIVSRRLAELPGKSGSFLMSGVVLMELTASARDDSQRILYERMFRAYRADNSLIIPTKTIGFKHLKFSIGLLRVDAEPSEEN